MKSRIAILVAVLGATAAEAQTVRHLTPDARVRLTAPGLPGRLYGRTETADSGRVVVVTPEGAARIALPLSAIDKLDVSQGRPRLIGGVVGGAGGLLLGGLVGAQTGSGDSDPEGWGAFVGMLAGATAGLTAGAILGTAFVPERWRTVHEGAAVPGTCSVTLAADARTRSAGTDVVAVKGERDRRAGVRRGAIVLGGVAVVFGGIDAAGGNIGVGEWLGTIAGNAILGGAVGYMIAPRGWQNLPAGTAFSCGAR